jgi:hypothetical protein
MGRREGRSTLSSALRSTARGWSSAASINLVRVRG